MGDSSERGLNALRSPTPGCCSDLTLDRWIAEGQTELPDKRAVACAQCRDRFAELRADAEAAQTVVTRALARAQERARRRWRYRGPWLLGSTTAVAAMCVVSWWWLPTGAPPLLSGVRAKGVALQVFVQREGTVRGARSGDRFQEGDALRFVMTTGEARYLFLVGIEENGQVRAYHPFGGDRSVRLRAGVEVALPGSLVLDGSPATEYFLTLLTQEPIAFEDIEDAVALTKRRGRMSLEQLQSLALPGRHIWFVARKR